MNLFIEHKIIISIVAAIMVAVLVVYSYGSFSTYAAAPEISTLPADIDIDVDYTADTVNFTYAGNTYSFDRNHNVNLKHYSSGNLDYNYPETFERLFNGNSCYASYWFSPSELRVYVLIARSGISKVRCYVPSANYGTFCVCDKYENVYYYMITIDYSSGSAVYNKMSSQDAIDLISSYDESKNRSCDNLYACKLFDSSSLYVNYYHTGYLDGDWFYGAEIGYKASGELNSSDYASNYHYIPNDLLCIFSNYEISGFYEPDTSKVNTPDYYFNYQYIFFKEGYGYIFVDSAKRCKEVGFPNGVNRPRFYFEAEGNNYVYSSVDGITWTLKSSFEKYTSNFMYNNKFEVDCGSYAFTDYTLVYTNDSHFGEEPLVTPAYGDITDVTGNLDSFLRDFDIISSSGRGSGITSLDYLIVEFPADNSLLSSFVGSFTLDYVYYCTYKFYLGSGTTSMPEYIHVYYFGGTVYDNVIVKSSSDTGNKFFDFLNGTLIDPNNSYQLVSTSKVPTFSMYFRLLNNTTNNIFTSLTAMRTDLHVDLKSLFKNVTLTNQYLSRIYSRLDDLKIPSSIDYSGDFGKLLTALDKLHNDLIYEEGVTKLPNVPQYLVYVYGVTKDIRTKLDNINVQISDDIVTFRKAVISRFDPVTEKLDSIIAKIPSGGGNFDDSNMVGSIVSLKADISDNFTTLIKLLKNDTDDVTDFKDLSDFLTSYIVSMGNAAYFTTLLDFADGVKNNVVLINDTMVTMVTDSGIFAPIFTLGAGFAVFSGLIRKERMS